jgi:hypothetical protein
MTEALQCRAAARQQNPSMLVQEALARWLAEEMLDRAGVVGPNLGVREHGQRTGKTRSLPSAPGFYLNAPVYTSYEFTKEPGGKVYGPAGIINFPGPLEGFCIGGQELSIFSDLSARRRPLQAMTIEET